MFTIQNLDLIKEPKTTTYTIADHNNKPPVQFTGSLIARMSVCESAVNNNDHEFSIFKNEKGKFILSFDNEIIKRDFIYDSRCTNDYDTYYFTEEDLEILFGYSQLAQDLYNALNIDYYIHI